MTKFVSEYRARNDYPRVVKSINAALQVQLLGGLAGSVLLVLLAGRIAVWLKISAAFAAAARSGIYMVAIGFLFTMLAGTYSSALRGMQSYDRISTFNIILNLLLSVLTVVLLFFGGDLNGVIALSVLYAVASFFVSLAIVRRVIPSYRFRCEFDKSHFRPLLSFSGYMLLSRVSGVFSTYLVRFVVAAFLGPAAVTYYAIPARMAQVVGGFLSSLFNVVFPFASELGVQRDMDKTRSTLVHVSRWLAALAVPLFLTTALFPKVILDLWMGREFAEKGWAVLSILSFGAIIGALTAVPNLITMGLGHSKVISVFSIFTVLCYAGVLPLFARSFGIIGAAWAILLAQVPGIFLVIYEVRTIMGLELGKYFRDSLAFHVVPVMLSAGFVALAGQHPFLYDRICLLLAGGFLLLYVGLMIRLGWLPVRDLWRRAGYVSR